MGDPGTGSLGGLTLYSYWRSSAAYRVRIGLNRKGLRYTLTPVHLVRDGGEQHQPDYRKLNPQGLVPTLLDGERVFRQSLAILEYLDEVYPGAPLLPSKPRARAHARALALLLACETHPLDNLRVLQYLNREMGVDEAGRQAWYHHWLGQGLSAFEQLTADHPATGAFSCGDEPGIADCCLVPQVYNARRFKHDLAPYPTIRAIYANCLKLPAFKDAAPENQPDAPADAPAV